MDFRGNLDFIVDCKISQYTFPESAGTMDFLFLCIFIGLWGKKTYFSVYSGVSCVIPISENKIHYLNTAAT